MPTHSGGPKPHDRRPDHPFTETLLPSSIPEHSARIPKTASSIKPMTQSQSGDRMDRDACQYLPTGGWDNSIDYQYSGGPLNPSPMAPVVKDRCAHLPEQRTSRQCTVRSSQDHFPNTRKHIEPAIGYLESPVNQPELSATDSWPKGSSYIQYNPSLHPIASADCISDDPVSDMTIRLMPTFGPDPDGSYQGTMETKASADSDNLVSPSTAQTDGTCAWDDMRTLLIAYNRERSESLMPERLLGDPEYVHVGSDRQVASANTAPPAQSTEGCLEERTCVASDGSDCGDSTLGVTEPEALSTYLAPIPEVIGFRPASEVGDSRKDSAFALDLVLRRPRRPQNLSTSTSASAVAARPLKAIFARSRY